MPNWCSNEITIHGEAAQLERLQEFLKSEDTPFDFEKVIPMPKEEEDNWYVWRVNNWGTKWNSDKDNFFDDTLNFEERLLFYSFDTAWSPSTPVTRELSKRFPTLIFTHKYEESGMDFSGYDVFEKGNVIVSKQGDYYEYPLHYREREKFDYALAIHEKDTEYLETIEKGIKTKEEAIEKAKELVGKIHEPVCVVTNGLDESGWIEFLWIEEQ